MKDRVTEINLFDKREVYENCTVEILTNSVTGQQSIGWWHGGVDDMPTIGANIDE